MTEDELDTTDPPDTTLNAMSTTEGEFIISSAGNRESNSAAIVGGIVGGLLFATAFIGLVLLVLVIVLLFFIKTNGKEKDEPIER